MVIEYTNLFHVLVYMCFIGDSYEKLFLVGGRNQVSGHAKRMKNNHQIRSLYKGSLIREDIKGT